MAMLVLWCAFISGGLTAALYWMIARRILPAVFIGVFGGLAIITVGGLGAVGALRYFHHLNDANMDWAVPLGVAIATLAFWFWLFGMAGIGPGKRWFDRSE